MTINHTFQPVILIPYWNNFRIQKGTISSVLPLCIFLVLSVSFQTVILDCPHSANFGKDCEFSAPKSYVLLAAGERTEYGYHGFFTPVLTTALRGLGRRINSVTYQDIIRLLETSFRYVGLFMSKLPSASNSNLVWKDWIHLNARENATIISYLTSNQ